ncbi:hypothetical protein Tsubulata_030471, partial [Turnera subulata]
HSRRRRWKKEEKEKRKRREIENQLANVAWFTRLPLKASHRWPLKPTITTTKRTIASLPRRNPRSNNMVTLLVATTRDPASINPATALLSMPGWLPCPSSSSSSSSLPDEEMKSYANEGVRLLQHGKSIIEEDDLDARWEAATGEAVEEVIFFSKHTAVSNRPALTIHPIGVPHLRPDEVPLQGGKPGWAAPPDPRMGPWLRLLKQIAADHNLVPEFEGTHHGPVTSKPTINDGVWVAHLLSGYSLPMDDPSQKKEDTNSKYVGGTWREAIKAAYEATRSAFPGGEIMAHLDHKSFKSWQKNAITGFLAEQNIKIGKPKDFY